MKRRRKFFPQKSTRTIILVACEDVKREPSYFRFLNDEQEKIHFHVVKHRGSDPKHVLLTMEIEIELKENRGEPFDEAWLVMDVEDKITRKKQDFNKIRQWSKRPEYNFVLSNPCSEVWFLYHFEKVIKNKNQSANGFKKQIEKNFCDGRGNLDFEKFKGKINSAITNARNADLSKNSFWPKNKGCTKIYKLVGKAKFK